MAATALVVEGLTVRYGSRVAVDALSLRVEPGEIVGLLGPNGAGKSTTLLACAGALMPSAGQIVIDGVDLKTAAERGKAKVGLADQPPSLYEFLTLREHVAFIGETRGVDGAAADGLIDALGLAAVRDRPCRELSYGMRQRVGLAAALIGEVSLLLLDETLNGLDPHATARAITAINAAAARGVGVLCSTHMLDVAAKLCGRVVIMDGGRVVASAARGDAGYTGEGLDELYRRSVADRGVS